MRAAQNPLGDLVLAAGFLGGLPAFLGRRMDAPQARAILLRRRARREAAALRLIAGALRGGAGSPYPALFRDAGCEYGDVERLARADGLEGMLAALYRAGIYLSIEEFKGRRPIRRGSTAISGGPRGLRNPAVRWALPVTSSGGGGSPLPVPIDLHFVGGYAVNSCLVLAARGGSSWVKAHWSIPGGGTLAKILEFTAFGDPPAAWFSQVRPTASGLHPRYAWSIRALRAVCALRGVRLPPFVYAPREAPGAVLGWIQRVLRSGREPHLFTFASAATSLARFARSQGADLAGVHLLLVGEPLTAARLALLRAVGADALPRYAANECGTIGYGCLAPEQPDDHHLMDDLQALIVADGSRGDGGPPSGALLVSSLHPSAPFLMVNVSLGDEAAVLDRRCGCPLERLGWTTHLHSIRSFEKLTSGGVAYLDTQLVQVLEEVLPRRFGGGPADYQLVEDESADGQPRLRLLVHPAVGELDPRAVAEAFLAAIGTGSGLERLTALLWDQAGFLRLERRPPYSLASGKVLHLHRVRRPAGGAD